MAAHARRRTRTAQPSTVPVAIFYENVAAADRALRSVRDALRRQRDRRTVQPLLWPIDLLSREQWLRFAADDVAAADFCLVSLDSASADGPRRKTSTWFRALAAAEPGKWITLTPFAESHADDSARLAAG